MNLTVGMITCRERPLFEWFLDSLRAQVRPEDRIEVIIIDLHGNDMKRWHLARRSWGTVFHTVPKPSVWQGEHRLTKLDFWAASNARNTGICLAQHAWLAFLDDRCVLLPGWLDCIREAQAGKYAVFGAYEKRVGVTVESGVIKHGGTVIGEDSRAAYVKEHWGGAAPVKCPGEWAFGCTLALPLEWALSVGGYDETCDGSSMEDVIFGLMLQNNGFDLRYDKRMKIIEDRTPEELGEPMIRRDKGISPNDKSHMLLAMLREKKTAQHGFDIRKVRDDAMRGLPFPMPWGPEKCFYDGQLVKDMA